MADETSAFENWQKLQKELHELERRIAQETSPGRGRRSWATAPSRLQEQAVELRRQVDALFPDAMKQLEDEVARLSARRHRLQDELD